MTETSAKTRRRRWDTTCEEEAISTQFGRWSVPEIAQTLGRSAHAVYQRRYELNFTNTREVYTLNDIRRLFRVGHAAVDRWRRHALLPAQRTRITRGAVPSAWCFTYAAILRFIRCYPWEYDPTRVQGPSYFRTLALSGPRYLSTRAAAARLRIAPSTLRRLVASGRLLAQRTTTGSLRFAAVDLDAHTSR